MEDIYISEATREALSEATIALSERFPYKSPEAIHQALVSWLEVCIEELATEVVWHCAEGDRATAMNRKVFERSLERQHERSQIAA